VSDRHHAAWYRPDAVNLKGKRKDRAKERKAARARKSG
jgi:hypothetical protein